MEGNLFYQNQTINIGLPINSLNFDFLKKLFSPEILSKVITNSNKNSLSELLPNNDKDLINDPQKLSNLLINTTTKFNTPINDFYEKYLHNFFTINYQKNIEENNLHSFYDFIQKKNIRFYQLQNLLSNVQRNAILNNMNNNQNINNEINQNVIINTHVNNNIDNITQTFDMHSELASSGYTSLEIDKESKHSISRKNSGNINQTQGDNNNINTNPKMNEIDNNYTNSLNKTGNKNKQMNDPNNSYIDPSDDNDSFIDRNILKSDRFKNVKKNKIQITIKPRTKEEIQNFREQEKERYKYPQKPWEYTLSNGNVAIVAPLISSPKSITSKPRDHELLKMERPPYITLLALVRDAAARLEDGVGTRLDICDLLKDSQYINENISENKINNIVSGALDRLHYQKDPCVKYDSHHKLWIYLHRNRSLDYSGWNKIKNNDEVNIVSESQENKSSKNGNNIIIEDLDDDNDASMNKKKEKEKQEEIIDIENSKDSEQFDGKNIVKIHNDSSEVTPPQSNLIEFNEKIYSTQKKKIKSSLIGKKRSKSKK
jgi:hypothetical protein